MTPPTRTPLGSDRVRAIIGALRGTPQQTNVDITVTDLRDEIHKLTDDGPGGPLWYADVDIASGVHVSVSIEDRRVFLEVSVDDPSDHELTLLRDAIASRMAKR